MSVTTVPAAALPPPARAFDSGRGVLPGARPALHHVITTFGVAGAQALRFHDQPPAHERKRRVAVVSGRRWSNGTSRVWDGD